MLPDTQFFYKGFRPDTLSKSRQSFWNVLLNGTDRFSTSIQKAGKNFGHPTFRGGFPKGHQIIFRNFAPCHSPLILSNFQSETHRDKMVCWFYWHKPVVYSHCFTHICIISGYFKRIKSCLTLDVTEIHPMTYGQGQRYHFLGHQS